LLHHPEVPNARVAYGASNDFLRLHTCFPPLPNQSANASLSHTDMQRRLRHMPSPLRYDQVLLQRPRKYSHDPSFLYGPFFTQVHILSMAGTKKKLSAQGPAIPASRLVVTISPIVVLLFLLRSCRQSLQTGLMSEWNFERFGI